VDALTIKKWLLLHGTLMTDLTEDKLDLELDSGEEELYQGVDLTTGTYSVKMSIHKPIPQFLPMDGKKVRIFYRGIPKLCSKCYGGGHLRKDCTNERDDWLTYVDNHMIRWDLDESYYGKWCDRINDWRLANENTHNGNLQEMQAEWEREKERRTHQNEHIGNIINDLKSQTIRQQRRSSTSGQPPGPGSEVEPEETGEKLPEVQTGMEVEPSENEKEEKNRPQTGAIPKQTGVLPSALPARKEISRAKPKDPEAAKGGSSEEIGVRLRNLTFDKNRLPDDKRGRGRPRTAGGEWMGREERVKEKKESESTVGEEKGKEKKEKVKTRSTSLSGK
jgi:hypothetical protein